MLPEIRMIEPYWGKHIGLNTKGGVFLSGWLNKEKSHINGDYIHLDYPGPSSLYSEYLVLADQIESIGLFEERYQDKPTQEDNNE